MDPDLETGNSLESVTSFAQTRVNDHKRPDLRQDVEIEDHKLTIEQVVSKYETNLTKGLSKHAAAVKLAKYGHNVLTPPKPVSEFYKFAKHLFSGFSNLLWVGTILCMAAYGVSGHIDHLILGVVLALVVIVTGLFSYHQESKSSRIMDSFKKLVPEYATVIRDGEKDSIEAANLVVGDLIEVNSGDKVPADIRIVNCTQLRVDNSSLTGESEPQSRSPNKTSDNPLETKNLAFYSSNCIDGSGQGIVIATGDHTVMGHIAGLTAQLETNETPIALEIEHFIKIITITSCSIGAIFFVLALANGYHWLDALIFLIGIIVANVPEGLLATVTVCLTLTAKRMAERQCLVKNLEAVETLGSTSVICSDKTGTLTKNTMTVSHCWYDNHMFKCEVHDSRRVRLRDTRSIAWHCLTRAAKLCSRARFRPDQAKVPIRRRLTTGDASESALLKWLESEFGMVVEYRDRQKKVAEIPFNSTDKYSCAIYDITEQRTKAHQVAEKMNALGINERSGSSSSRSTLGPDSKLGLTDQQLAEKQASNSEKSPMGRRRFGRRVLRRGQNKPPGPPGKDAGLAPAVPQSSASRSSSTNLQQGSSSGSRLHPHGGRHLRSHRQFHMGDEVLYAVPQELDRIDANCRYLLVMKGAPERVLERCNKVLCSNEVKPLDSHMQESFLRAYESMGGLGERVIGFADLPLPLETFSDEHMQFNVDQPNFPLNGLRFLGLISMIDPPRASVPDAVSQCRNAGIRIIMSRATIQSRPRQ